MEKTQIGIVPVRNACHLKSEDAARLPFLLQQMLDLAVEMFGQRDESFSVTGIVFWERCPKIRFPKEYEGKEIDIWLQIVAGDSIDFAMKRACYQLAHETVHLLSPVRREMATILEEGVACCFAVHYMTTKLKENEACWMDTGDPKYQNALNLVKPYLDRNKQAVRELRRGKDGWRKFGDISEEELMDVFPFLAAKEARVLTSLFESDGG